MGHVKKLLSFTPLLFPLISSLWVCETEALNGDFHQNSKSSFNDTSLKANVSVGHDMGSLKEMGRAARKVSNFAVCTTPIN